MSLQDYPPFEVGNNTDNGKGKGKGRAYPTYPMLMVTPNGKKQAKSYGGYAWAKKLLLLGGTSPPPHSSFPKTTTTTSCL